MPATASQIQYSTLAAFAKREHTLVFAQKPRDKLSMNEDLTQRRAAVFVVATPIGNLDDMTPRARRTLENADLIAAEDTRHARKLLTLLGISGKNLVSYQDHGEEQRAAALLDRIVENGLSLALVSDAGTPCVSDPGYRIVSQARARGISVHPVPGVSAVTTLVSAAGLPCDRFTFIGFLPARAVALQQELESWQPASAIVFFESARRLKSTLAVIAAVHPGARIAIGRELTKLHEEIVTLPIAEAMLWVESHATLKGEATCMISIPEMALGEGVDADALLDEARAGFARGATLKDLLRSMKDRGLKRTELYQLLLKARQ